MPLKPIKHLGLGDLNLPPMPCDLSLLQIKGWTVLSPAMGPVIGFALDNTVKYKWQCDSSKPETQEAPLFYLSSQGFVFSIRRSLYTSGLKWSRWTHEADKCPSIYQASWTNYITVLFSYIFKISKQIAKQWSLYKERYIDHRNRIETSEINLT